MCVSITSVSAQLSSGTIEGVIRDASGAVLPNAVVTANELRTSRSFKVETNPAGFYRIRGLRPGLYRVIVSYPGFKKVSGELQVSAGASASFRAKLPVGDLRETVEVETSRYRTDPSNHELSAVLGHEEIRSLPMNGRNFLDAAQLLPGVQLLDAHSLEDPMTGGLSKRHFTGVSMAGRSGRTTRVSIDGIDISDEFVGTTLLNLSPDAIQELEVSYASMDPSKSLTSQGAINIVTQNGGNAFHGSAFFFGRDSVWAALPVNRTGDPATNDRLENADFSRQHLGFQFGGPIAKERLFFFLNYEDLNQQGTEFIFSEPFPQWNGPVRSPFHADMATGRLDWDFSDRGRLFYRFTHDTNRGASGFGGAGMSPVWNTSVANVSAIGADLTSPQLMHSLRYGHSNFNTEVSSRSLGLPVFTDSAGTPVTLSEPFHLLAGPHVIVPQHTYQTNDQVKYDGFWLRGDHSLRFGGEVHYIRTNFFWAPFGSAPFISIRFSEPIRQAILAGGGDPTDPLEYPISSIELDSGLGYFSEISNHGRELGGLNNTRLAAYLADQWKLSPNLTLNLGLRYELDTGQVNDDLSLPTHFADLLGPEGIEPPSADTNNFAPQVGFAWQPFSGGRTVIRGGAGLFYETDLLMNRARDRALRLPDSLRGSGIALSRFRRPSPLIDSQGRVTVRGQPVNGFDTRNWIGRPAGSVLDEIGQTFRDFQGAWAAQPFDPSDDPLISVLWDRTGVFGSPVPGPLSEYHLLPHDYESPFAIQTNLGLQHQLVGDWLISTDFLWTRSHHQVVRSANNLFAADTFNAEAARSFLFHLAEAFGFSTLDELYQDYLAFGDPFWLLFMGTFFEGDHPDRDFPFWTNDGRSDYRALQLRVRGRLDGALPGIRGVDLDLSYALGRYSAGVGDQDSPFGQFPGSNSFVPGESGPSGFDRTHQLNLFFRARLPGDFLLNVNHRMRSPRPTSLRLAGSARGADTLFYSDIDGDGRSFDFLPGTERGSFGRNVDSVEELNNLIRSFNETYAGTFTPAAQTLIDSGLFTEEILRAFNVVIPETPLAPSDQALNDSFLTTDIRFGKRFRIGEDFWIEPAIEVFNLFNIANYPVLSERLGGWTGSANGTPRSGPRERVGRGSGSFGQGIPRALQFMLRVSF